MSLYAAELAELLKSDYYVGRLLGTGARSEVFQLKHRRDGRVLAAKYIRVATEEDQRVLRHMENEYDVLRLLSETPGEGAKHIVRPVALQKVRKLFRVRGAYLLMEYAKGRSLFEFSDYSIDDVLTIFRQVCLALEHVHHCNHVHADMKPNNVVVDKKLKVKLVDFGFAAPIGKALKGNKGTFGYLAPEQSAGMLSARTDVFNVGAAMYKILTGVPLPSLMPGEHGNHVVLPDSTINLTPLWQMNEDVPPELSDMVVRCCAAEGHKRPTVAELKQYLHGLQLRMQYGTVGQ